MKRISNGLFVAGGLALVLGGLDPMEGSLLVVPASGMLALAAWLGRAERRVLVFRCWTLALTVFGVAALWGLSMMGGFGGTSGRSMAWGWLILPYLAGWTMGLWGPGSPRWLSLLGLLNGVWFIWLSFVAGGAVAVTCAALGMVTIAGCSYRLFRGPSPGRWATV